MEGEKFDYSENTKAPYFNRSLTIHHHNPSYEFTKKPLLPLDRSGSVKKVSNSSFGSSMVKKLCSIFERAPQNSPDLQSVPSSYPKPSSGKIKTSDSDLGADGFSPFRLPGTEDRVVIYFTSLRGIRRTYTDCCAIRMIFKAFRVNLDERDISMDSAYKKELQSVLGEKMVTLPQVFIKGKYIGGADVVKQLNETGELVKMLKGLSVRAVNPGLGYICEGCGDVRFVPCSNCNGSRKLFDEDEEQLKRCPECNENGLVRCPECCY